MLEPDVTLTDYMLALQCLCFAILIYRRSADLPWTLLFGSLAVASLAGGTVHGFLPDESSAAYAVFWRLSLIAIGAMTLAAWHVGAAFLRRARLASWIRRAAILQFVIYAASIVFYSQAFLLAALNYLSAAIFLLFVFVRGYLQTRRRPLLWGASGIVLTFIGSFVQIAGIALHPTYFNHNALYHAIQFVALCLLFASAWNSIDESEIHNAER